MAPRFAAANASLFSEIVGAERYTDCDSETQDCPKLRDEVGVDALDDLTLEVRLKRPQPWFVQLVANWAFLPVHEPTIEQYKRRWTDPANIVTNGPFLLADWVRRASITLERWDEWRDAGSVRLARIEGAMIADPAEALAAFEGGDLDACLEGTCVPPGDSPRLAQTAEFEAFPAPVTRYLVVDLKRVPDPAERRAIAIALNRRAIVVEGVPGAETPATSLTPNGLPGFAQIDQGYLTDRARRGRARRLLKRGDDVRTELTLGYPADARELADLIRVQLGKVGLDVKAIAQDPDEGKEVDLELASVSAPGADAIDVLGRFVCGADGNGSGFCDERYDGLVKKARTTVDDRERYAIYGRLEGMLTGRKGAFPGIPLYWDTQEVLRRTTVEGFEPNLLGVVDFTRVTL